MASNTSDLETQEMLPDLASNDNTKEKKIRKFMPHWLKSNGWLKYDEEKNFMYCEVCTKFNRKKFPPAKWRIFCLED